MRLGIYLPDNMATKLKWHLNNVKQKGGGGGVLG